MPVDLDSAEGIPLSAVPPPCVRYAMILASTVFQTSNVDYGVFVLARLGALDVVLHVAADSGGPGIPGECAKYFSRARPLRCMVLDDRVDGSSTPTLAKSHKCGSES
jgi:hypothetical protein